MRDQLQGLPTASGEAPRDDTNSGSLGTVDLGATQPIDVSSLIMKDGESL
jgi:hypothetical protein